MREGRTPVNSSHAPLRLHFERAFFYFERSSLRTRAPLLAVDSVNHDLVSKDLPLALRPLAEAFGDAYRVRVVRVNEAYDVRLVERLERILQRRARRLRRVAAPPIRAPQSPPHFQTRP